jgi:flavorubredoxin
VAAKIKPILTDVSVYDLVCMGTPVWSSSPSPPVNGYLAICSGLKSKKAACFATYGGGNARITLEKLRAKLEEKGAKVIGSLGIDSTRLFSNKVKDCIRDFAKNLC